MKGTVILATDAQRAHALDLVRHAPLGHVVTVQERTRSLDANAGYWADLQDISEQVRPGGKTYDKDTWHIWLKREHFGPEFHELPGGAVIEVEPRSRFKNRSEFSDYREFVKAFGSENGVRWTAV